MNSIYQTSYQVQDDDCLLALNINNQGRQSSLELDVMSPHQQRVSPPHRRLAFNSQNRASRPPRLQKLCSRSEGHLSPSRADTFAPSRRDSAKVGSVQSHPHGGRQPAHITVQTYDVDNVVASGLPLPRLQKSISNDSLFSSSACIKEQSAQHPINLTQNRSQSDYSSSPMIEIVKRDVTDVSPPVIRHYGSQASASLSLFSSAADFELPKPQEVARNSSLLSFLAASQQNHQHDDEQVVLDVISDDIKHSLIVQHPQNNRSSSHAVKNAESQAMKPNGCKNKREAKNHQKQQEIVSNDQFLKLPAPTSPTHSSRSLFSITQVSNSQLSSQFSQYHVKIQKKIGDIRRRIQLTDKQDKKEIKRLKNMISAYGSRLNKKEDNEQLTNQLKLRTNQVDIILKIMEEELQQDQLDKILKRINEDTTKPANSL